MRRHRLRFVCAGLVLLVGCFSEPPLVVGDDGGDTDASHSSDDVGDGSEGDDGATEAGDASAAAADSGLGDGGQDSGGNDDASADGSTDDGGSDDGCSGVECSCERSVHRACDGNPTDLAAALGLGCSGEPSVEATYDGSDSAVQTRTTFGLGFAFDPTEGERYVVLGTGIVTELDETPPVGDDATNPLYCNDDLGDVDPGTAFPAPMNHAPVDGDCFEDPTLVGTGDCSKTLVTLGDPPQLRDLARLSLSVTPPPGTRSLRFDTAFLTTEYPAYIGSEYSDTFIAWVSSEQWTGNVAYDGMGRPVGVHSSLLVLRDDDEQLPELSSTCIQGHAATEWITTSAPIEGGEPLSLVFAVVDLTDNLMDSFAFVDAVQFSCDAAEG